MTTAARPRETVEQLLRAAVSASPGDMADCYAPRVVIEMPLAVAPLYPPRIETTREELRARFAAGAELRRYTAVARKVIHETADPDVIVADYALDGRLEASGETFTLSFLMIITFRDGLIAHSRDFTDTITGARVLGRLPELVNALSGGSDR
jgi:hypothetical protein